MKLMMMFFLGASLCLGESIFDGKSMKGWTVQTGEERLWRVEGGAIIGGALTKKVPHNTFMTSEKRYGDFELTLQVKVEGKTPNAGVQIRSERKKGHHEMIGYQADVGPGWWGKLYDESRRNRVMGSWVSEEAAKASKKGWNDYKIRFTIDGLDSLFSF